MQQFRSFARTDTQTHGHWTDMAKNNTCVVRMAGVQVINTSTSVKLYYSDGLEQVMTASVVLVNSAQWRRSCP